MTVIKSLQMNSGRTIQVFDHETLTYPITALFSGFQMLVQRN